MNSLKVQSCLQFSLSMQIYLPVMSSAGLQALLWKLNLMVNKCRMNAKSIPDFWSLFFCIFFVHYVIWCIQVSGIIHIYVCHGLENNTISISYASR